MSPGVSVAMCTYQGAAFVGEQLESILSQDRPPDEVLVFDDASTDDTLEIVRRIADASSVPVRVHANPATKGYRRNFEMAIRACTGDVIFLADQDDVWLPAKISTMLLAFEAADAVIAHCDAVLVDPQLRTQRDTIFSRHPVLGLEHREPRLALQRLTGIPGCTLALRSSLTEMLLPFSDLWGHDLWITLLGDAVGRVVAVAEPLMLYRRHTAGVGPSRHLDAGPAGRARQGVSARHRADYELDLGKWRQIVEHLEGLEDRLTGDDPRRARLAPRVLEYRRRLDLAHFRERMRRRRRATRVFPVLRRVVSGDYRRYLRPLASPVKDVVL